MKQPDKIFREKLRDHVMTPPAMTWDRVEAGLQKNKKGLRWYHIAASVAILIAASVSALVPWHSNRNHITSATTPKDEMPRISDIKKSNGHNESRVGERRDTIATPPPVVNVKEQRVRSVKLVQADKSTPKEPTVAVAEIEASPVVPVDSFYVHHPKPTQLAFKAESNTTIVISAKESSEYLLTESEADATSESKKSSTLKRLFKKAADLKINQDPFGELRQKKNEILALNFGNEKRGQKK